jgi:hypothetical protein
LLIVTGFAEVVLFAEMAIKKREQYVANKIPTFTVLSSMSALSNI